MNTAIQELEVFREEVQKLNDDVKDGLQSGLRIALNGAKAEVEMYEAMLALFDKVEPTNVTENSDDTKGEGHD